MTVDPWYRMVTLRKEVREGRSFSPDEFAIAVVADTAPEDYRAPAQFFSRTSFAGALQEHTGMVLRRLSGKTEENGAGPYPHHPQFSGGKTHTLTSLYHLANTGAAAYPGLIWRANWPASTVSPRSVPPPGRRRRAPRLWQGCSPRRSRRCCCCSMRCSTSSIVIDGWPRFSTPSCKTLTLAVTGTSRAAAVVSLPRSQV